MDTRSYTLSKVDAPQPMQAPADVAAANLPGIGKAEPDVNATLPDKTCLTPAQVDQLLADVLPEQQAAALWEHAESCPHCTAALTAPHANHSLLGDIQAVADRTTTRGNETLPLGSRGGASSWQEPSADAFAGYELRGQLSSGGQGVVFRAYQTATKRDVAIKVLRSGGDASFAARRRFEREVELASQLRHPNIVTIFDSGVASAGEHFYVMDFVPGLALDKHIASAKLSRDKVLELVAKICDAVSFAHRYGVIHRDLKPSNILVDDDGRPLVLDFGLARKIEVNDADPTETGQVLGTLPYMSPEQAAGDRATGTLTDVYALGVILYKLLAGQFPYPVDGSPWEVVKHIMSTEPTSLIRRWSPETGVPLRYAAKPVMTCPIDSDLETIVLRALQKEPERRYQSAADLGADLRRFIKGEAIEAKRDSGWYVAKKYVQRNKLAVSVVMLLMIAIGGFGATTVQALLEASDSKAATLAAKERSRDASLMTTKMGLRSSLGWALHYWQQGRPAHEILRPYPPKSSERFFLNALLSKTVTPDDLREQLPANDHVLADLLAVERAIAARDLAAAQTAYSQISSRQPGSWPALYANGRISELQQQLAAVERGEAR